MRALIASLAFTPLFFACGEKRSFNGGVATAVQNKETTEPKDAPALPESPAVPGEPVEEKSDLVEEATRDFEISLQTNSKVDMVWLIDNSPSMAEEAAQVRANLEKFTRSIASRADLRMTLISADDGQLGAKLSADALAKGHMQLARKVDSRDSLALLASSLCGMDDTYFPSTPREAVLLGDSSPFKLCGIPVDSQRFLGKEMNIQPLRAQVLNRLRADSSKVFVVVSDDNVEGPITADNFLDSVKLPSDSVRFFAFAGQRSRANCDISQRGVAYESLAAATGGEVFDICERDWSANFSKLSDVVIRLASNRFKLDPAPNMTVTHVYLDGIELPASAYSFDGSTVQVKDEESLTKGKVLRVVYSHN